MRHEMVAAKALASALALLLAGASTAALAESDAAPECHLHRSEEVNFRESGSKDVLEISIGTGPCYAATLTIIIRTEYGDILYSYVAKFKRHTARNWEAPNLPERAREFVEKSLSRAIGTTASLPPYANADDYYEANSGTVQVSEPEYEQLRAEGRPMLFHLTHYEMWQYVVYDSRSKISRVVVRGGL